MYKIKSLFLAVALLLSSYASAEPELQQPDAQLLITFTFCGKLSYMFVGLRYPQPRPGELYFGPPLAFSTNNNYQVALGMALYYRSNTTLQTVKIEDLIGMECVTS